MITSYRRRSHLKKSEKKRKKTQRLRGKTPRAQKEKKNRNINEKNNI